MAPEARPTKRRDFSRWGSVLICLCAFALLPLPQLACLASAESTEQCPCHEDLERCVKKLAVWPSARQRLREGQHSASGPAVKPGIQVVEVASNTGRLPVIVGHQLANGLRAPLLI